jgi:aromatic ring-cleaving dioxygenase
MNNHLKTDHYHVHVYYELDQLELASDIRQKFISDIPEIDGVGPLRQKAVGPHPIPMFEAWFSFQCLEQVIEWMEQNNQGLSVMFHPLSGNDFEDHATYCWWIGKELPLKLEIFK